MAGKLFPEAFIGDSEDVSKKPPTGRKHFASQRDIKSPSPQGMDTESHDSGNLTDSGELKEQIASECEDRQGGDGYNGKEEGAKPEHGSYPKEESKENQPHQKPQYMDLLDFGWLQEKEEEEEAVNAQSSSLMEDNSPAIVTKNPAGDTLEGLWPPPVDNTEEHLEPRVNEVALIDSFESDRKLTPSPNSPKADGPESSSLDHEGYYLCDDDGLLKESSASTGYFPCYRTYVEFPRYQPPAADGYPPCTVEKQPGNSRDASVQCDGCLEDNIPPGEKRGAEANNNSKDVKSSVSCSELIWGQTCDVSRPGSGGRKSEGSRERCMRLSIESGLKAGENRKEQEVKSLREGISKPHTLGSSSSRPGSKVGVAKEAQGTGLRNNLPPGTAARKSPQKKKHRVSRADEEQARLAELKPLLPDQRSLPPSPEEKTEPLHPYWYGTETMGGNSEVRLPKARGKGNQVRILSTRSCAATMGTTSPSEAHATPSRLSLHSIVTWVRKIFRKSSPTQPQPSTSRGPDGSGRPVSGWLRLWLAQHRSRVHPQPP